MEARSEVRRSLNPEAPEFFPAGKALVSANFQISSPLNIPSFPQYQTLPSPTPPSFSAPRYCYPFYCPYWNQYPVQYPCHLITEKAAFPPVMTEPVSSLLEEAAQEPKPEVMVEYPKRNVRDSRRRNRRLVGGFTRADDDADADADHSQSQKKMWKPKRSCGNEDSHLSRNGEASFEYPSKVQGWINNENGERKRLIPLKSNGNETTVMIKNIPNRFTREMLKDVLDQHCKLTNQEARSQNAGSDEVDAPVSSAFDFLYLPIDFYTKSNKGYAFVNFTNKKAVRKIFDEWHGKYWDCFQSKKIREIYCAKLQGVEQLLRNFERMDFPSEDYKPVIFSPALDGSADQVVEETRIGRCSGRMGAFPTARQTKPKQVEKY